MTKMTKVEIILHIDLDKRQITRVIVNCPFNCVKCPIEKLCDEIWSFLQSKKCFEVKEVDA